MRWRWCLWSCLGVLAGAPAIAGTADGEGRTFQAAGLTIAVTRSDSAFSDSRAYQVVVSDELRTLSRLEVNRDGVIANAWLTDLDHDGAFEIVVATALLEGEDRGAVDIHEWRGGRFVSTAVARLPAGDREGYHGNDQFSVHDGRLLRAFPVFTTSDDDKNPVPTGQMARFHYDADGGRWQRDKQ